MMNPADTRALLAIIAKNTDRIIACIHQCTERLEDPPRYNNYGIGTDDEYLAAAQQILESSWNPSNYKHPAGMDESKLGVSEAIGILLEKGYTINAPPEAGSLPVVG